MRRLDIRRRMLLAALLPVAMVSLMLAGVFLMVRFDDMQESYQQRIRSVARQLALASEYGLFSANQTQLQTVVRGALRDLEVRGVVVMDEKGQTLARAGEGVNAHVLAYGTREEHVFEASLRVDTLSQPVFATEITLDDLYEQASSKSVGLPAQLGQVVVSFSRQEIDAREQSILMLGGLISVLGLVFGMVLAAGLSRGLMRPILRVTHLIERVGRGDFSAATENEADVGKWGDPLADLQNNLRKMAARLAYAQEELERQVRDATQALRKKKEEAEQATQAKSRFLAAASHDLRQPTHALGMFVSRLAQLPHDQQTRHLIVNLEASVQAMQNLLDGLLDISRLEARAVQVKLTPFLLPSLFEQLQLDLGQAALDKGLRLRIRDCSCWVVSDATLLYRILLNLVGNALRYTDRGGVLVACRSINSGTQVQLQVWDSGIGIAPEYQDEVFKEFYQVGNAARNRNKGLGLGLSIVQRTAELLSHPLALVSRPGVGTRFTLTLSATVPAEPPPGAIPQGRPQVDGLLNVEVLVVEDDALVRAALVGLLGGWGIRVHEAQGLTDAQALIQAGVKPDLIVSDYRLQGAANGIDVVQQLRAQLQHDVPACLMSGDTDVTLMTAARVAGLTLLHKPVRPAKLRNLLRHLLAGDQPAEDDLR